MYIYIYKCVCLYKCHILYLICGRIYIYIHFYLQHIQDHNRFRNIWGSTIWELDRHHHLWFSGNLGTVHWLDSGRALAGIFFLGVICHRVTKSYFGWSARRTSPSFFRWGSMASISLIVYSWFLYYVDDFMVEPSKNGENNGNIIEV